MAETTIDTTKVFDDGSGDPFVILNCQGQLFRVSEKIAIESMMVKSIHEEHEEEEEDVIDIINATPSSLEKALTFMQQNLKEPLPEIHKPIRSVVFSQLVPEWYASYMNISMKEIFELLLLANYLDVGDLITICSAKIATFIKGKSPEDIRKTFNLNVMTNEEEDAVIKEYPFIMDIKGAVEEIEKEKEQEKKDAAAAVNT